MFHSYGILLGIAIVLGWSVAERIDNRINKVLPWVLFFGLLGARIYHVIDLWDFYKNDFYKVLELWNGGLGIWGGIVGGAFGFYIADRMYALQDKNRLLAAITVGLPLAQAIGRLGNAVSGEFLEKVWVVPWWSAEMIADLALFAVVFGMSKRKKVNSRGIIGVYLIGYGLIRFGLEFWRENNWEIANIAVAQWVAIMSIVIGLLICQASARD